MQRKTQNTAPSALQPLESSNAQPLSQAPTALPAMKASFGARGNSAYDQPQPTESASAAPGMGFSAAGPGSQLPRSSQQAIEDELVLAEPGDRRLEGMQSPSVVIHKRAPEEVKVGKPATFVIHVQNVGSVEALDCSSDRSCAAG